MKTALSPWQLCPLYPNNPEIWLNELRSPSELLDLEEFSDCINSASGAGSLHVVNPAFDFVPPKHVSLFITDTWVEMGVSDKRSFFSFPLLLTFLKLLYLVYLCIFLTFSEVAIAQHSCTVSWEIITLLMIWWCNDEPLQRVEFWLVNWADTGRWFYSSTTVNIELVVLVKHYCTF